MKQATPIHLSEQQITASGGPVKRLFQVKNVVSGTCDPYMVFLSARRKVIWQSITSQVQIAKWRVSSYESGMRFSGCNAYNTVYPHLVQVNAWEDEVFDFLFFPNGKTERWGCLRTMFPGKLDLPRTSVETNTRSRPHSGQGFISSNSFLHNMLPSYPIFSLSLLGQEDRVSASYAFPFSSDCSIFRCCSEVCKPFLVETLAV